MTVQKEENQLHHGRTQVSEKFEQQPRNAEQGREPETTIEVASLIGEERYPLPGEVPDEISRALMEADSLPAQRLGGMAACHIPTHELRSMTERYVLADEDSREELRNVVYEQRTKVLRRLYQEAHNRRQLPGRVFRRSGDSDEYMVASLAGETDETHDGAVYFYNGRFWYEDGDSPELLDTQAHFLPEAATTNAVVSAYSANLTVGLAPVECLPGTYPVYCTMEEYPTPAHKYYEPLPRTVERVSQGDSFQTAAAEFIKENRLIASTDPLYLSHARMYDGTNWEIIFSESSRIDVSQRRYERDQRTTEAGRQLRKHPGS